MMNEPSFTRGRKWAIGFNVVIAIASAFAIVVMVNYLAARHSTRVNWVDLAGNKLSPLTQRVLSSVTNKVKVIVYFSRNDPLFGSVTGLLKDYQLQCPNLELEVIDYRFPGRSEKIRAQYNLTSVTEGSRIIFDCAGRTRVIGAGELSDYAMGDDRQIRRSAFKGEQLFTSAILTVTSSRRIKAYFLGGHGEHAPENQDESSGYLNFARLLSDGGAEIDLLEGLESRDVPDDCSLLIIPGPQKRFGRSELERIDAYLKQGGRMLVTFNHLATTKPYVTGLEALLANWNVDVGMNVVQDIVNEKSTENNVVIAHKFSQHPIVRPLMRSSLEFVLPRSIASKAIGAVRADAPKATELVFTSEKGVAVGRINEKGMGDIERQGPIPLAIAVEKGSIQGVAADKGATRIVVVGSSIMFANAALSLEAANADFATLTVNWLLNRDVWLTDIPPRAIKEYTLSITERQMRTLRWIFMFGAPAAVLLIGGIVWLRRRS